MVRNYTSEQNKIAIMVFNDILGTSNNKYLDQFFIRGSHNISDKYHLSQSLFDLPKKTKGNNSNKIILLNQLLKDTENMCRGIGRYDLKYDEFKQLCRKGWEEEYRYLCINRSKKRDRERYCICNEIKNTYIECIPEIKLF